MAEHLDEEDPNRQCLQLVTPVRDKAFTGAGGLPCEISLDSVVERDRPQVGSAQNMPVQGRAEDRQWWPT